MLNHHADSGWRQLKRKLFFMRSRGKTIYVRHIDERFVRVQDVLIQATSATRNLLFPQQQPTLYAEKELPLHTYLTRPKLQTPTALPWALGLNDVLSLCVSWVLAADISRVICLFYVPSVYVCQFEKVSVLSQYCGQVHSYTSVIL